VPVDGTDEAGRLGAAFNEMLAALARSKDDQQRLVQDASHELRTPLTSLRTNISVLRRHDRLAPDTMAKVLDDLDGEARELTDLTNELVELATDRRSDEPPSELSLGVLAERVAARAARRTGRRVVVDADAAVVTGRPLMLERAITNLVDNAAKFDEGGEAPIEVVVRQGTVEVLDRGPGIAPADLPHLFDRFYRASAARSCPGSGLGLAIVKGVAEVHAGSVFAAQRPGGGAVVGFKVPAEAFQPCS
jgi:two-component system sensor histidine kinase MprB